MNVSVVHIIVTHKRLVLTQTEAIVVLVQQDSLAMVHRVQVCNICVPIIPFITTSVFVLQFISLCNRKLTFDESLPVSVFNTSKGVQLFIFFGHGSDRAVLSDS